MNKKILTPNGKEIELEPWLGRYYVGAKTEAFRSGDSLYDVSVKISCCDPSDKNIPFLQSLGLPKSGDYWEYFNILTQIADTFSEQQADELVAYLNSLDGFQASKRQAFKPTDDIYVMNSFPMKDGDCWYDFYEEEGYPLDFKVRGHFYLGDENRIGPSPEEVFRGEIKNTLKWCPTAEREKVLQMILDLFKNDEKSNNLDDDLEIWPGRFNVIADLKGYQFLDTLWTVRLYIYLDTLSHTDGSSRDAREEFKDDKYGIQAKFTFSEKQADELVSFINTLVGFKAWKLQAYKPNERLSFLKCWSNEKKGEELYYFTEEESYPFDYNAVGFFDLNLAERIGPLSEKQLWFEIDRALEPLSHNERDRLLQLALDIVNDNVNK